VTSLLPFRWHLAEVLLILAAGTAHHVVVKSRRERRLVTYALLALLVVTVWPVGDLASSVSLSVATVQRLVIMLLVSPLILMATPTSALVRLTRPRFLDAVTRFLAHPGVSIAVVTVVGTATLSSPVVDWGARSSVGRGVILLTVLCIGVILWIPALGVLPGAKRLSPVARAGYLFASSLVVTSLSFVWIFSRHSLYPALHHQRALLDMTPLFDQQLAGFVAKFGAYAPMWAIAFTIFSRADEQGTPVEETPLYWADVERQLLRLDRQRERALRRHQTE
jgi:cytochrome c oxidase assembly factor CtaG